MTAKDAGVAAGFASMGLRVWGLLVMFGKPGTPIAYAFPAPVLVATVLGIPPMLGTGLPALVFWLWCRPLWRGEMAPRSAASSWG